MSQKHCPNCGSPLKPDATLCPRCGAPVAAKSQHGRIKRNKMDRTATIIAVVCVLCALGAAAFYIIRGLPRGDANNKKPNISAAPGVSANSPEPTGLPEPSGEPELVPEADSGGSTVVAEETISMYITPEEDIATDDETGVTFAASELIVTVNEGVSRADVEAAVRAEGGEIVGNNDVLGNYQLKFGERHSMAELDEIGARFIGTGLAERSDLNFIFEMEPGFYPTSDKNWPKKEWSGTPGGGNWGMEAINAPEMWEHRNEMDWVDVGVFDTRFFEGHEDLVFTATLANSFLINSSGYLKDYGQYTHGTHVSGTIAAGFDNGKGVTGVMPKVRLYGASFNGSSANSNIGSNSVCNILTWLIADKHCKVVNVSMADQFTQNKATNGDSSAKLKLNKLNLEIERTLLKLLKENEFVIVKAAGNDSKGDAKYEFLAGIESGEYVDWLENEYFSMSYDNRVAIRSQKNVDELSGEEIEKLDEEATRREISELVDGAYEIAKRTIVVGQVELLNKNGYDYIQVANHSSHGNRVDIVAPGTKIESTVAKKSTFKSGKNSGFIAVSDYEYKFKDGHNVVYWSGTSMAAPHVSGVAAAMFGVNSHISGAEVKRLIIESAAASGKTYGYAPSYTAMDTYRYPLLDAKVAVEAAIAWQPNTTKPDPIPGPVNMEGLKTISAGEGHSLAIKADGTLWAWGDNTIGVLGDGTTKDSYSPIEIMDNVASVSVGGSHTMAIKTDGSLWGWGYKIGIDPIKIMDNVASVSAGASFTMAIKTDESLWGWGYNEYGWIGSGTVGDIIVSPVKVMDNVAAVSTGFTHTMAIKADGTLWAWGSNYYGELGDGTTNYSNIPIKIMDNVASVSAGQYHTMAIKTDGTLWAWGVNIDGELGDGTIITDCLSPIKIMDSVASVSAGTHYTMAARTDGSLWAWGMNYDGQLGIGMWDQDIHSNPVKVMDGVRLPK